MGKENQEKFKQFGYEREKMRTTNEEMEVQFRQAAQLEGMLEETNSEIVFIMGRNDEIKEVNGQLGQDLRVCQRHMENVLRVNRGMEEEIALLQQTSMKAIAKLQQPLNNRTNQPPMEPAGWEKHSRSEYETGESWATPL